MCDIIETLLIDEYRAHILEDAARGQFKRPPESAEQQVEQMLSRLGRPVAGSRGGGMTRERAARMAADAASYDAEMSKG